MSSMAAQCRDVLIKHHEYPEKVIKQLSALEVFILSECVRRRHGEIYLRDSPVVIHGEYKGQVLALTAKGLIAHEYKDGKFLCKTTEVNDGKQS